MMEEGIVSFISHTDSTFWGTETGDGERNSRILKINKRMIGFTMYKM